MASPTSTTSDAARSAVTHSSTVMTKVVVTAPPWAKDEPPSPIELAQSPSSGSAFLRQSQSRFSLVANSNASTSNYQHDVVHFENNDYNPWWTFTRRTKKDSPPRSADQSRFNWTPLTSKQRGYFDRKHEQPERPFREAVKSTWLLGSPYGRNPEQHTTGSPMTTPRRPAEVTAMPGLHSSLPVHGTFTISQNQTPGWETPWSPHIPHVFNDIDDARGIEKMQKPHEYGMKKCFRGFILNNTYAPLLFRLINIVFTTAALVLAISIRDAEQKYDIMGALGCSPTLVIIFAPPSLVHVMVAIYLEYFGHPLGLWRTSSKLIYTLSETLFICAWSSALSLCFDNFFTSVVGCAPASAISWYNQIPRPIPDIPNVGHGKREPGEMICDRQIVLIALVFVGLIMYCANLIIGLFRIFEKVKHTTYQR